jgi:hypothetical protein
MRTAGLQGVRRDSGARTTVAAKGRGEAGGPGRAGLHRSGAESAAWSTSPTPRRSPTSSTWRCDRRVPDDRGLAGRPYDAHRPAAGRPGHGAVAPRTGRPRRGRAGASQRRPAASPGAAGTTSSSRRWTTSTGLTTPGSSPTSQPHLRRGRRRVLLSPGHSPRSAARGRTDGAPKPGRSSSDDVVPQIPRLWAGRSVSASGQLLGRLRAGSRTWIARSAGKSSEASSTSRSSVTLATALGHLAP